MKFVKLCEKNEKDGEDMIAEFRNIECKINNML